MPTSTPTPTGLPNQVDIGPGGLHQFSPSTITITAGQTVNWVWRSSPHSTTSGSCPGGVCAPDGIWDSGIHSPPQTFSHMFPAAGTFTYYCRVHLSTMQGTVIVNP
jgi:plastocyanin